MPYSASLVPQGTIILFSIPFRRLKSGPHLAPKVALWVSRLVLLRALFDKKVSTPKKAVEMLGFDIQGYDMDFYPEFHMLTNEPICSSQLGKLIKILDNTLLDFLYESRAYSTDSPKAIGDWPKVSNLNSLPQPHSAVGCPPVHRFGQWLQLVLTLV